MFSVDVQYDAFIINIMRIQDTRTIIQQLKNHCGSECSLGKLAGVPPLTYYPALDTASTLAVVYVMYA